MRPRDSTDRVERNELNSWLTIALFGALLLVPVIAQIAGVGASSRENRELASFPKLRSLKEIKDLTRMSEDYVDDRFGLRDQLVRANSLLRYRMGLSSNKDVAIGRDGWLFYTADKILEQHTGADIFKPDELERWVRQMEANRDWLDRRGIAFYIVAAPDKNSIYPEKLPGYPRRIDTPTRLEQLTTRLQRSTLDFINPKPALLAAKEDGVRVYFEGDSHWTQRGAFVTYTLLMEQVRKRFPTVTAKRFEDYSVDVDTHPVADLARHLDLENELHYSIERLSVRGPKHQVAPAESTSRTGWGPRISEIHTDLHDRPRLLVMGDSFTDYVLGPNFLYETFRDPVWTHHNLGAFNFDLIKEVHPDIVIFQFAERYLHSPLGIPIGAEPIGDAL